jgi:hypothetical protein
MRVVRFRKLSDAELLEELHAAYRKDDLGPGRNLGEVALDIVLSRS